MSYRHRPLLIFVVLLNRVVTGTIGRLNEEGRRAVGEYLVSKGYGEWLDSNRNTMRVTWRTPDDWGRIIYKHFSDSGLLGTIYTFYELHSGDVSEGTGRRWSVH